MKKSTKTILIIGGASVMAYFLFRQKKPVVVPKKKPVVVPTDTMVPSSVVLDHGVSSPMDMFSALRLAGDAMTFTTDSKAGATVVPLSPAEVAALSPDQQAALNQSKKGLSPILVAGAVAAAVLLV